MNLTGKGFESIAEEARYGGFEVFGVLKTLAIVRSGLGRELGDVEREIRECVTVCGDKDCLLLVKLKKFQKSVCRNVHNQFYHAFIDLVLA